MGFVASLLLLMLVGCTMGDDQWGAAFRKLPTRSRMVENMAVLTAAPRLAGTPEGKDAADWVLKQFQTFGFDEVTQEAEPSFMTYPLNRSLSMLAPVRFDAPLKELPVESDPYTFSRRVVETYNAYSANGDVRGSLVYANFGSESDFAQLEASNVTVKGNIAIIRYFGGMHRGIKVRLAAKHGAVGVILYSDPQQDGFVRGPVYPDGPWRPPSGVQRGSCAFVAICPGDLRKKECGGSVEDHMPSIPVQPISYMDATPFLQNMGGPVAPAAFQGGLPFRYTLGGDPSVVVHLSVHLNSTVTDIWNVCGTIYGQDSSPGVLLGNHRDQWTQSATDPTSGQAVLIEIGRAFGLLHQKGWVPKRSITVCSWDGEEFSLLGNSSLRCFLRLV